MVVSLLGGQAIYVRFLSPRQLIDSPKFAEIPAETPRMENLEKIGTSSENPRVSTDRRVSVAPMMDCTDARDFS